MADSASRCPRLGESGIIDARSPRAAGNSRGRGSRPMEGPMRVHLSAAERFWSRVDVSGECWLWTGATDKDGYGHVRTPFSHSDRVHVYAWYLATGERPSSGLIICHTCDTPACTRNDGEGVYEIDGIAYQRQGHLWLGTHAANQRDKALKGRAPQGDLHPLRLHPEWAARGDNSATHRHPETRARGDRNGSRLHPERLARGDNHGSRLHPESLARGERHGLSKLNETLVRAIRVARANGENMAAFARAHGVHKSLVYQVVAGKIWRHVT